MATPTPTQNKNKGTDAFKKTIADYIGMRQDVDLEKHPDKTIDGCINYILTTVKKSGCCGFTDDEIYGMAVHYYDEPNESLKIEKVNCQVVVNHQVELTEEEKQAAKNAALEQIKREQLEKLRKPVSKPVAQPTTQEKKLEENQMSLF